MPTSKTQSSLFDSASTAPRAAAPSAADASLSSKGTNTPEFTVSELSNLVKKTVEDSFALVRVRGEISDVKLHSSGHMYLTLKEGSAVLASVCWKGQVGRLGLRPEIGMEVICTGRLTTFPGQSKYQLVIEAMSMAGIGALLKMLEERKKKLAAEGLFDASRKRALPYLPSIIGVVTSPTGAVIRDILHRLAERFPRHVLVWPVAVQGDTAAAQIAAAIMGFNALGASLRPDILIVARGGGSVEDLMPFNEENVVRAVAESTIPIISAVGHETDTTLIDFVSDLRAPTPSAAAEKAVPVREHLLAQVMDDGARLFQAMQRMASDRRERLHLIQRALGDPSRALEPVMQRLDATSERFLMCWPIYVDRRTSRLMEVASALRHPRDILRLSSERLNSQGDRLALSWRRLLERAQSTVREACSRLRHPRETVSLSVQRVGQAGQKMDFAVKDLVSRKASRFDTLGSVLHHLSPRAVLGRGYALVQDRKGQVIASASQIHSKEKVRIEFHDGAVDATTE